MARAKRDPELLRAGERVVAAVDLPRIPEGTTGKVTFVEGFTWIRYWARFDNGETLGSIHRDKLARPAEWDELKERRARGEEPPVTEQASDAEEAAAAVAETTTGDGAGDAATGAASRVPAHLLERSKRRRQELGL